MTTERKSYSSNKFQLELPYLIEVQKASYEQFLQADIPQEKRLNAGLQRVFQDIFPITDPNGLFSLEYEKYYFGIPKYSIPECRERGLTYNMELYATLALRVFEKDGEAWSSTPLSHSACSRRTAKIPASRKKSRTTS